MIKEFKKFLLRGNMVDLVIGFTVGAAFSNVARSLVTDIVMPPIGLLLGRADFTNLFWTIKTGFPSGPYATVAQAQEAGAVTVNYGIFLNNLLSLILVGLTMFLVIRFMNRLESQLETIPVIGGEKNKTPANKKCPYCRSTIAYKAIKCPQCTADLPSQDKKEPDKK
jgi:large conductance mechanosensitive channel